MKNQDFNDIQEAPFDPQNEQPAAPGTVDGSHRITLDALLMNIAPAVSFVETTADKLPFSKRDLFRIELCVEEIVTNIVSYAYAGSKGSFTIEITTDCGGMTITMRDRGIPYDPLKRPDPDITLTADERGIGGYGIYLVKQIMDDVRYEHRDGMNVLSMRKNY